MDTVTTSGPATSFVNSANDAASVKIRLPKTQAKYDRLLKKYGMPAKKDVFREMDPEAILKIFNEHSSKSNLELGWSYFGYETSDNLVKGLRVKVGAPPSPFAGKRCSSAVCQLDKLAEKRKKAVEKLAKIDSELEEANMANDAELAAEERVLEERVAKIKAARGKA